MNNVSHARGRGRTAPVESLRRGGESGGNGHKRFDRAYFQRWYHDPASRVHTRPEVERKVRMVLSVAEYVLGRPVRTVLDVCCGEGRWLPVLRAVRPGVRYSGVDASEYAVQRYGRRRNIMLGRLEHLDQLELDGPFDLVVCCDALNYLDGRLLSRGLRNLAAVMGGVAYLELWTRDDDMTGDLRGWHRRPAAHYERLLRRLKLTRCAPHCYVGSELSHTLSAMERH